MSVKRKMRWSQFQSMRMCCSAAAACWRGSMEDARLAAAGGCPVTEESWRLGLAPLEAGHKSWAVAVSPSVLTTPVSPYSHYLQWPSLTTTRYVSSVHSCSVILPTREIVRPSNPRAQTELLTNVGDMFLRQRSERSCHCHCCVMSYFIHRWAKHI